MTFGQSIASGFARYADFKGRASRSEYWWWILFTFLASMAASIIHEAVAGLFSLAVLLPTLAVGARRLHDTDRSGWFLLISLIPLIGWLILIYWMIQPAQEPNRFGGVPATGD